MEHPFDLLEEVKLAAPMTRAGTIVKQDAIARLCAATAPFATVVAPAGFGKTTLLARWSEVDSRPFARVALDRRDEDSMVFLRYSAAAMHLVEPLAELIRFVPCGRVQKAAAGSPARSAVASSLRELMPSFGKTLRMCHSTVRGLRNSCAPISGFE